MRNKKLAHLHERRVTLSSQKGDPAGQSVSYKPFGLPSRVNLVKVKQCGECSTRAVGSSIWGQLFCSHKRSLLKVIIDLAAGKVTILPGRGFLHINRP